MILRQALELQEVFFPMIFKQIHWHLFVLDIEKYLHPGKVYCQSQTESECGS